MLMKMSSNNFGVKYSCVNVYAHFGILILCSFAYCTTCRIGNIFFGSMHIYG